MEKTGGKFVEDYLLFQLTAIRHSMSSEFYAHLRSKGVNPARWRLLANLVDGGMYISELVRNTFFEQSHVTKLVDQLCAEGLVERRKDEEDRRRVKVHITPKGLALTKPLIEDALSHEDKVLSVLPERDRERFKSTLSYFVQRHFKDGVLNASNSLNETSILNQKGGLA